MAAVSHSPVKTGNQNRSAESQQQKHKY